MLLQYGADPRLYAEDGLTPSQQSSFENVRNVLDSWDIAVTDRMLQKLQADQEKQRADDRQMTEVETQRLETQLLAAEKEYDTVEKQVNCLNLISLLYLNFDFSYRFIIPATNRQGGDIVLTSSMRACVRVCVRACVYITFSLFTQ